MADVQVTDNSDLLVQATATAIMTALEAIGLTAEGFAKRKCPVDTGRLRNSITHAISGKRFEGMITSASYGSNTHMVKNKQTGQMEKRRYSARSKNAGSVGVTVYQAKDTGDYGDKTVYIGTNVEYAKTVEEGNSRQRAQPYLKPAIAEHIDDYKRILESTLKNV